MRKAATRVLLLCLTACWAARFAPAREVRVTYLGEAPTVDGRLDEPCWGQAVWNSGLVQHADPGQAAKHDTRFALACDDEFLFVGAEMSEPAPDRLSAAIEQRDGNIYRDDCIQLFIDPDRTDADYFSFSLNSRGQFRDTKKTTIAWNADLRAAAQVGDHEWSVEAAIPLGDLELTPASCTAPWGCNLTRVRRVGTAAKLSTFAPLRASFHQPEQFVPCHVPVEPLTPYVWDISAPDRVSVTLVAGVPAVATGVQVKNLTARFAFFLIQASVHGANGHAAGQRTRDGIDAGDAHLAQVSTPVGPVEKGMFVVSLFDALRPTRLLARRQFVADDLAYSPIHIALREPWYKNAIFATQQLEAVVCEVRSDLPETALASLTLTAGVYAMDGTPVAAPVALQPAKRALIVSIPIPGLRSGEYRVRVALLDAAGKAAHSTSLALRRLAPLAGEVRFDRNMACLVDGKPFFPFGWFGVSAEQMERFAADGYNTIGAYGPTCTSLNDDQVRAYLDQAHGLGMKVICRPQPSLAVVRSAQRLLSDDEAGAMRELVRKWREHPAVLAWYMCDEPEGHSQPLERRMQEYRLVDEEDPYHPAIVLNNTVPGIHKYHPSGDLLMPDVYPGFLTAGGASRIDRPMNAMSACREATDGRKPVWITPQGQIQMVEGHRAPTFRELRNQAWQGAAHDAMGFFWYRDCFLVNLVESKLGVPAIHREMLALLDAVRTKSVPGLVTADAKPEDLTVAAKRHGEHVTLIAVSLSTAKQHAAVQVTGLGNRALTVLSEARAVHVRDGRFEDDFEPYEAHVYTTDTTVRSLPTVRDTETGIRTEFRARHKPGNLAYHRTGARIAPEHHGGQAAFLNDGSTVGVYWPRQWGKVTHPLPNWVEVVFPLPQTVGRVEVYSVCAPDTPPTLLDAQVQVCGADGAWTDLASVRQNAVEPTTFRFSPVATERLRLRITDARGKRIRLQEIEVYAR